MAFGDIHGCYLAAQAAVSLAKKESAHAVFLGDYVDRGPDSIKTLEILIGAKKKNPTWVFLRGNHDQMLLDLIEEKQQPNTCFGIIAGETSNEQTTKVFYQWQKSNDVLKQEIESFLRGTVFYHELDKRIFVHSPLRDSSVALNEKSQEELIWNYNLKPTWNGKQFIHGHAPVETPVGLNQGININTSCGYGGLLTGMLVDISCPYPDKNPKLFREKLISFSITENGIIKDQNDFLDLYFRESV